MGIIIGILAGTLIWHLTNDSILEVKTIKNENFTEKPAIVILNQRLAKGEIEVEEY